MVATQVKQMKCACLPCLCIVDLNSSIVKEGKHYCSDSCASNHSDGGSCAHGGCDCH